MIIIIIMYCSVCVFLLTMFLRIDGRQNTYSVNWIQFAHVRMDGPYLV